MARNIVRFNPLRELEALQRQFFGDDVFLPFRGVNLPTTDVYTEGEDRLVVEAHLPNFDPGDINVDVDEGALIVQAEKRERQEDKSKKYMVRESSSSFYRRIVLPERADDSRIEAHFENGVLTIVVPFTEQPAPKKIAINAGSSQSGITSGSDAGSGDEEAQSNQNLGL